MKTEPGRHSGFVGRSRELALFEDALSEVSNGAGRIIAISGEPGIGKTRTAEMVSEMASDMGFRTYAGHCYEGEGAPLYWPWMQVFRTVVAAEDPDRLAELMESSGSVIAELEPRFRLKLPDLPKAPAIDDPLSARFRLFDACSTFFQNLSADTPVLIFLDDLHWSDRPSLLLLGFLASQGMPDRLLIIGTYRDVELNRKHPLQDLLGELARERCFERVMLRGLDASEVADLMAVGTGDRGDEAVLEEIYRQTDGNPLFVQEVAKLLKQSSEFSRDSALSGKPRIPEGIREAIGRRLNRLSEPCNDMLAAAAVIGRAFDTQTLSASMKLDDTLNPLIDEALDAGIIEKTDEPQEFRFDHALTQRTLLEELSTTDRVGLHAAVATALEERYGDEAAEHAIELARHHSEAETISDPAKVVKYLSLAGEMSLEKYAHEDAVSFFSHALKACKRMDDDIALADILFGLGRAQAATADDACLTSLAKAFELYETHGLRDRAILVASCPMSYWNTVLVETYERAVQLTEPGSIERGRILNNLAFAKTRQSSQIDELDRVFDEATVIAEEHGDAVLRMRIEANRGFIDAFAFRLESQLERSKQTMELARTTHDVRAETLAAGAAANASYRLGNTDEGIDYCRRYLEGAEKLGERILIGHALHVTTIFFTELGRFDDALRLFDRMNQGGRGSAFTFGRRATLAADRGDREAAAEWARRASGLDEVMDLSLSGGAAPHLAALLVRTGDGAYLEPAKREAAKLERSGPKLLASRQFIDRILAIALALIAYFEGDSAGARATSDRIEKLQEVNGAAIATARMRGFVALTLSRFDEALAHFSKSIELCREQRFVVLEGWDRFFYAEALSRRGRADDIEAAATALAETKKHAEQHGLVLLRERVESLLESMKADAPEGQRSANPGGLTDREVEVLRLVVRGLTNKAIATELFISTKTVNNHLRNVFGKLGVSNRAEAAAYAVKHSIE